MRHSLANVFCISGYSPESKFFSSFDNNWWGKVVFSGPHLFLIDHLPPFVGSHAFMRIVCFTHRLNKSQLALVSGPDRPIFACSCLSCSWAQPIPWLAPGPIQPNFTQKIPQESHHWWALSRMVAAGGMKTSYRFPADGASATTSGCC